MQYPVLIVPIYWQRPLLALNGHCRIEASQVGDL